MRWTEGPTTNIWAQPTGGGALRQIRISVIKRRLLRDGCHGRRTGTRSMPRSARAMPTSYCSAIFNPDPKRIYVMDQSFYETQNRTSNWRRGGDSGADRPGVCALG